MTQMDIWTFREETIGDIDLVGFKVEATDGDIGKIDEATYDIGGSYMVVDTGPWIFGRKVVLPAGTVDRIDTEAERVFVNLTKQQIKDSPELDLSQGYRHDEHREQLGAYYGEPALTGRRGTAEPPL
jgi:hypothetical protein